MAANTAREAGRTKDVLLREAGRTLGGAISHVGGQIGAEIDRHNTMQWIGHGAAASSSLHSDFTRQWNEVAAKADPNDTSIFQGFKEKILDPSIEKFLKAFEGAPDKAQEWALTRADQLREHISTKMSADMGTRAASAVHKNLIDLERNYSNTVKDDPSALAYITESIKGDVGALVESTPYLSATQAAHVRDELVPKILRSVGQAAFYGMAQANPDEAKLALTRGDFNDYLDAHDKVVAGKFADEVITQKRSNENHERVIAERELKKAQDEKADGYIRNILTGKSIAGYETDLGISRAERENIANFQHQHTIQLRDRKENTPHPQTYRQLLQGMFDQADRDPNNLSVKPIRDAFNAGRLNPREEAELEQRFNALDRPMEKSFNAQVRTTERAIRSSIMGNVMATTQPDEFIGLINRIEKDAHDKLDAERKRPGGDVNPLLDPQAKEYLFSPAVIRSYLQTTKQVIQGQAETARTGEPAVPPVNDKGWKLMTDRGGNRAYVSPDKKQFEEVGQPSAQPAATPVAAQTPASASAVPKTYVEWSSQQNSMKAAVEAKGWPWEPDRWNYSIGDNGEIERELSPGREWLKANYEAVLHHRNSLR